MLQHQVWSLGTWKGESQQGQPQEGALPGVRKELKGAWDLRASVAQPGQEPKG